MATASRSKSVTPEDLVDAVIDAYSRWRRQAYGENHDAIFPGWKRAWLEPFFNVLGSLLAFFVQRLPWRLRCPTDIKINALMGGRTAVSPVLEDAKSGLAALARRLQAETGQWPAAILFNSHPPTLGDSGWVRFELMRHGLMLGEALAETRFPGQLYKPHPQSLLAIDPFALETVPLPMGGLYSGLIHAAYFAVERQPSTQSWLQRTVLLRNSPMTLAGWRLLKRLRRGVGVVMALGGAVAYNSRLMYTAREFIQGLALSRWPMPKRAAEKRFIEILGRPVGGPPDDRRGSPTGGRWPAETGILEPETLREAEAFLKELGVPDAAGALGDFQQEFRRETPYRRRLFEVLVSRLVRKGTPMLWIAITHRDQEPYVHLQAPWGCYADREGKLMVFKGWKSAGLVADADTPTPVTDANALATAFGKACFT